MTGLNINIGGSVLKREARPVEDVALQFKRDGWTETANLLNGRLRYVERSGVNLTLLGGPLGTAIFPSGPVRGMAFGDVKVFSRESVIGAGKSNNNEQKMGKRTEGRVDNTGNPTL